MRTARIKGTGGDYYHCMSRIIERRFLLGDLEKEKFRSIMRACEAFSGVRILTYALMSNHFHILVEVPVRGAIDDSTFLHRLRALYARSYVHEIEQQLDDLRSRGNAGESGIRRLKERYTYRMGDVSEFLKTLKQRFTQWYNTKNNRRGTLWEERFKSVLVEGRGNTLATMAAYIDLNPVRAGLVADPKDYLYCGYAEAVAGQATARTGIGIVSESLGQGQEWRIAARVYREQLTVRGEPRDGRPGISPEGVRAALEQGPQLTSPELLLCRVRYFTDGVVLGGREFVESIFRANRAFFGAKRKTGARPLRQARALGLCTARDLRREPIAAPV